jgi:hypothetical protein
MMKTRRIDRGGKYDPCFGVNATQSMPSGTVSVGELVSVLEEGTHDNRGIWKGDVVPVFYDYEV